MCIIIIIFFIITLFISLLKFKWMLFEQFSLLYTIRDFNFPL